MPTTDERREVAARLRNYIDFDFGDSNPYWYVMKAVYGDVAIHDDNELFNRLADLIEPSERTCHVVSTILRESYIEGQTVFEYEHKLSCGHIATSGYKAPPNYCFECGARVIGG